AKALNDKYPYLRRKAISSIKKALKNDSANIKNILLDLAKNDPQSKVRGNALIALSTYFKDDEIVKETIVNGVSEESYYVIASSLEGLSAVSYKDALKFAQSFESEENNDIKVAIAGIYAEHGGKDQNAFFLKSIKEASGFGKYGLVSNYSKFLKKQDGEIIKEALPTLESVAKNEKTWWVRLTGINALADIEEMYKNRIHISEKELKSLKSGDDKELDLRNRLNADKENKESISSILNEIKDSEKNPRLRKMMGLKD
ncbi:MAG: hypothetical protein QMB65_06145, partial [Vicingaceae bacterium]